MKRTVIVTVVLLLAVSLFGSTSAALGADEWGTVKGQIVWGGGKITAAEPIDVKVDQTHCLSKGKLFSEKWVISKDGGVKWVFVWLIPEGEGKLPIHEKLAKLTEKEVVIDQPCCQFQPHVLALREGQVLVAKNSSPIAHNIKWEGGSKKNESGNILLPAGGSAKIEKLFADNRPVLVNCNVHPWMGGYVRVFDHPYYAVTGDDGKFEIKLAPGGKVRRVIWHEDAGWGPGGKQGEVIKIEKGKDTDLGKIEIKPAE